MGYACPVCEDPQADAGHLANHLAFTAITGGGDHEEWLDEHVPGWGQLGEAELAERVTDHAAEREFPQVFEASGLADDGDHAPHDHGTDGHARADHGVDPSAARSRGRGELDAEAKAILAEAQAITEEMRSSDDESGTDGDDRD